MFNNGTVDNINGYVDDVYGFIIGVGNVTGNGSLIKIFFKTKNEGICDLVFDDVCNVTNESMNLESIWIDGFIEVESLAYDYVINNIPEYSFGFNQPFSKFVNKSFYRSFFENNTNWSLKFASKIDDEIWIDVTDTDLEIDIISDEMNISDKYILNFTASATGYYKLNFTINQSCSSYWFDDQSEYGLNVTIPGTEEIYPVVFNWSDVVESEWDQFIIYDHGLNGSKFFFNVLITSKITKGSSISIDPIFGYTPTGETSYLHRNNGLCYIRASRGRPTNGNGNVDNVTVRFENLDSTESYQCALYNWEDNDTNFSSTLVTNGLTETKEVTTGMANSDVVFNFSTPPSVTDDPLIYYYICCTPTTENDNGAYNYIISDNVGPDQGFYVYDANPISYTSPLIDEDTTGNQYYIFASYTVSGGETRSVIKVCNNWFLGGNESFREPFKATNNWFLGGNESFREPFKATNNWFLGGNESFREPFKITNNWFLGGNVSSEIRSVIKVCNNWFLGGNESFREPFKATNNWFLGGNESYREPFKITNNWFLGGNESYREPYKATNNWFLGGNDTIREPFKATNNWFLGGNVSSEIRSVTKVCNNWFLGGNESSINIILSTNESVVSAIVEFDSEMYYSNYSFYFSKNSPVTILDNHTYIDPSECNKTGGNTRKMIIQELENNTKYYYRLYNVDNCSWVSSEYNFTTDHRFIIDWKDEFFDLFLVNNSNNIDIIQGIGIKNSNNPFENVSEVYGNQPNGYGYINVFNDSGIWRFWALNYSGSTYNHIGYSTSYDGINWIIIEDLDVSPLPNRCYPNILKENNIYYNLYKSYIYQSISKASISSSNTPNGTFYDLEDGKFILNNSYVSGNEIEPSCLFNDTYRNNIYWSSGQGHTTTDLRYPMQFIGFNLTDWLYFNRTIRLNIEPCGGEELLRNDSVRSYMFPVQIRSGVYLGIHHYYNLSDETIRPFLVVSRDGINYNAINYSIPIIPLGNEDEFDEFMILTNRMGVVSDDSNDFIYYNGWDNLHNYPERSSKVGRIEFRRDGLTFLNSSSGNGWLKTSIIPSNITNNLIVNGFFDTNNKLNISVINSSTGNPFTGFSFNDFDTITVNSTQIMPTWNGYPIDSKPIGDYQLNFSFDGSDGKLFSYSVEIERREPERIGNNWFQGGNGSFREPSKATNNWFLGGNGSFREPSKVTSNWFLGGNETIEIRSVTKVCNNWFLGGNATRISISISNNWFLGGNGSIIDLSCFFTSYVEGHTIYVIPFLGSSVQYYKWKIEDDIKGETGWIDINDSKSHSFNVNYDTRYKISLFCKNGNLSNQFNAYVKTGPNKQDVSVEIIESEPESETKSLFDFIPGVFKNQICGIIICFILLLIFLYLVNNKKGKKKYYEVVKKRGKK